MYVFKRTYKTPQTLGITGFVTPHVKCTKKFTYRTVANEACDNTRVMVNGRPAKASYDVKVGDKLQIQFGARTVCVEVLQVADNVRKDDAVGMYREIAAE